MKLLYALINVPDQPGQCIKGMCALSGDLLITFLAIVVIFLGYKYIYEKKRLTDIKNFIYNF